MLGTRVRNLQTVREVSFDDLAPVLGLLRTRHLRQCLRVHVANASRFSLAFLFYIGSYVAPIQNGRDKFYEASRVPRI